MSEVKKDIVPIEEYDCRLSKEVKNDSWAKRLLIRSETDDKKNIFFISFSIIALLYLVVFQIVMIIQRSHGYQISLTMTFIMVYFTISFIKQKPTIGELISISFEGFKNIKELRRIKSMFFLLFIMCIGILKFSSKKLDTPDLSLFFEKIFIFNKEFRIKEISNNTYIYYIALCCILLGVISSFSNSYTKYKIFKYSAFKKNKNIKTYSIISILLVLFFIYAFVLSFNSMNINLHKSMSLIRTIIDVFIQYALGTLLVFLAQTLYYLSIYLIAKRY